MIWLNLCTYVSFSGLGVTINRTLSFTIEARLIFFDINFMIRGIGTWNHMKDLTSYLLDGLVIGLAMANLSLARQILRALLIDIFLKMSVITKLR